MVEIKEIVECDETDRKSEIKSYSDRVGKYLNCDEIGIKVRYNLEKFEKSLSEKCDEKFKKHKAKGNFLFAAEKYEEAAIEYSQAIIWAKFPKESDNQISFAFGNRSAALMKLGLHSECLEDVEIALKYGYPSDQKEKLIKRKQLCLQFVNNRKEQRENEFQFKNNTRYNSDNKIVANRSLKKGDTILVENPWCTVLKIDYYITHCYNCLKKVDAKRVFPCFGCTKIRFCSEHCSLEAWNTGHRYECCYLGIWSTLFYEISKIPVQLAAKIVFRVDLLKVLEAIRTGKESDDEYFRILKLKDPGDKCKDFTKSAALLVTYLGEFAKLPPKTEGRNIHEDTRLLGGLLLKHLQQIQVNSLEIIAQEFTDGLINDSVKHFQETAVGDGLYTICSSLEHSCNPNAHISGFNGRTAIVKALRDIEANEVITMSYGVTYKSHTTAERLKYLKSNYFFNCKCYACTFEWESNANAFMCPECKGAVIKAIDVCSECGKKTITDFGSVEIAVKQWITKAKAGSLTMVYKRPDLRKAEHSLVESYRALIQLLFPLNKHIGVVNDKLSLCYKLMRRHDLSLKYMVDCLSCVEVEYGEQSIAFINALMKLMDRQKSFINHSLSKGIENNEKRDYLEKVKEDFKRNASRAKQLIDLLVCRDSEQYNCAIQILTEQENCSLFH